MSKKAIVFKDRVWNIESGAGWKLKLKEVVGEADEVAVMVGLLASEDGAFINGQLLQVNGGAET